MHRVLVDGGSFAFLYVTGLQCLDLVGELEGGRQRSRRDAECSHGSTSGRFVWTKFPRCVGSPSEHLKASRLSGVEVSRDRGEHVCKHSRAVIPSAGKTMFCLRSVTHVRSQALAQDRLVPHRNQHHYSTGKSRDIWYTGERRGGAKGGSDKRGVRVDYHRKTALKAPMLT